MTPSVRALVLLAATTACLGCGRLRIEDVRLSAGPAWPPESPRVQLIRILRAEAPSSGRAPVLQSPSGVAWDGAALLVADSGARSVLRIDGAELASSPSGALGQINAIALCPEGVVVTDPAAGQVWLLGADLKPQRLLADGLDRPTGVACSENGVHVVETGRHRVLRLGPAAAQRAVLGGRGVRPGEFNFPTTLAVAGNELLVGDTLNFRIQTLDARDGSFLRSFGRLGDGAGDTPRTRGIAVDSQGHVWVSDSLMDRVCLYSPDGVVLMCFGGTGAEPGKFSFPAGVAANTLGEVAIADSMNRRVQVFRLLDES